MPSKLRLSLLPRLHWVARQQAVASLQMQSHCSSLPVQGLPSLNSESTEPALGDNGERVVQVVPVRLPEWTSDVPPSQSCENCIVGYLGDLQCGAGAEGFG